MKNLKHYLTALKYVYRIFKRILIIRSSEITAEQFDSGHVEFYLADHIRIEPCSFAQCEHYELLGEVFLFQRGAFVAYCSKNVWELMQEGVE